LIPKHCSRNIREPVGLPLTDRKLAHVHATALRLQSTDRVLRFSLCVRLLECGFEMLPNLGCEDLVPQKLECSQNVEQYFLVN
jgi:hypothetical protein